MSEVGRSDATDYSSTMHHEDAVSHVIFIYHRFDMGGIETLILRAAGTYVDQGLKVTLCTRPGKMLQHLDARVNVILFDRYRELYRHCSKLDAATAVIAFDPVSFMVMRRLQLCSWVTTGQKSRGHVGVFHPRAWTWPGDNAIFRWICRRLFLRTSDKYLFYMSKSVMDETSARLKLRREITSQVIHLPIAGPGSASWVSPNNREISIVSVGRLVPAKCYNRSIPRIVQHLSKQGIVLQWDIWGGGDDFVHIQKEILELGVQDRVRLRGVLDYSKFDEVVKNYDLFVGIGTAILEAAVIGVPSICAIDFDEQKSYGFLDSAPSDAIGEEIPSATYTTIEQCVRDFAGMTLEQRRAIGARCRAAALAKSSTSEGYTRLMSAPLWPGFSLNELWSLMLGIPYLFCLDSRSIRRLAKSATGLLRWVRGSHR